MVHQNSRGGWYWYAHIFQRTAKGASGKGPRQKTSTFSRRAKKCFSIFRPVLGALNLGQGISSFILLSQLCSQVSDAVSKTQSALRGQSLYVSEEAASCHVVRVRVEVLGAPGMEGSLGISLLAWTWENLKEGSEKGVFWKRGLFRKIHLLEILEN